MNAPLLSLLVAGRTLAAHDIVCLELVAGDGAALPSFTAGAHLDVHLPGGLVRPYSLCNDPAETHRYVLGVLKEPASRGGSLAVHALQVGDVLSASVPRNHFPLAPSAGRHLLMAGGIGVTPLLSMARSLARGGLPFEMHYSTRSPERTAFADEIRASGFADRVHFHHDDTPASHLDLPGLMAAASADTHLYVCGPGGYLNAVLGAARAAGWAEARLHSEVFNAEVVPQAGDSAFEVELAASKRVIPVAADQTVAQALTAAGVFVPLSCEQGVCGTCLTRVLAGVPEHRDLYLTPEEQAANDQFTPCCSRARTARLVIDL